MEVVNNAFFSRTLGQTDLTSRFVSTCNMAVEWAMHGVEPYTSEHAQYFQDEEVVMPTSIVLDYEANIAQVDVAFLHFLLNYFHRALQPLLRKVHIMYGKHVVLQVLL